MQQNPNPESRKFFLLVESGKLDILMEALESGIHGVESRIRDCLEFPYMGRQGDALTPDARRKWNSLMTLLIWAALLAMKMALAEILIK